ncbi:hypothetical protein J6590_078573 [Homalodisca vitripennis]|nr:hypothetical protein J6590_078573 [Homalodisca vitripennis]
MPYRTAFPEFLRSLRLVCLNQAIQHSSRPTPAFFDHRRAYLKIFMTRVKRNKLKKFDKDHYVLETKWLLTTNLKRLRVYSKSIARGDGQNFQTLFNCKTTRSGDLLQSLLQQGSGEANGLVYSAPEKADLFADCMQDQFSPHLDLIDQTHTTIVEVFLEEATHKWMTLTSIVHRGGSIQSPLQATTHKSPWPGLGFSATGLFNGSWLYNRCLQLRHFPALWKKGNVVLLPKPVYHLISLLNPLQGSGETFVARFPEDHLSHRDHSTTFQLARVTQLTGNMNMGLVTTSVFVRV